MKTAVFIPVRLGSTRLPKKALLKIKGKTVIEHLIERVKAAKLPNLIVLCTTTNPEDSVLIDIAGKNSIQSFRGSEKDILDRYLKAALRFDVDFIIDADGDDPFVDPEYIDKTIDLFIETHADFIMCRELPLGTSPIGIKVGALKKVCQTKDESNTETGWGRYFTETGLFKVVYMKVEDEELKHPEIRMTLDYPEDYEFAKEVFSRLYVPRKIFTLRDILNLLKNNPAIIIDLNKHLEKEYWEYFKKHSKVQLKKK